MQIETKCKHNAKILKMSYTNSEYMKIRRYVINLVSSQKDIVQLPTIMELSKMFGVSRPTVSKAMKQLTEDGFVIGKPGLGSFVNPARVSPFELEGKPPVIGLCFADGMMVHFEFFMANCLAELMKAITDTGAVMHMIGIQERTPDKIFQEIQRENLDGIIFFRPTEKVEAAAKLLHDHNVPVVISEMNRPEMCSTVFYFEDLGYRIGKQLIAEGKTNLVFFPDSEPWHSHSKGLRRAFADSKVALNENLFFKDYRTAVDELKKVIQYGGKVDAVYSAVFSIPHVAAAIHEADPKLLNDCVIIGCDQYQGKVECRTIEYHIPFDILAQKTVACLDRRRRAGKPQADCQKIHITFTEKP